MVRKAQIDNTVPSILTPKRAIGLLRKQIAQLDRIQQLPFDSRQVKKWHLATENLLHDALGKPDGQMHENTTEFLKASPQLIRFLTSAEELQKRHIRQAQNSKAVLESIIEQLKSTIRNPTLRPILSKSRLVQAGAFVFCDRATGEPEFEVEASPEGTMPVDRAASLLAVHCLTRAKTARDYAILVLPREPFFESVLQSAEILIEAGRATGLGRRGWVKLERKGHAIVRSEPSNKVPSRFL